MFRNGIKAAALSAAAFAGLMPAASLSAQQYGGEFMYKRVYYDDAEKTIQVGYNSDFCTEQGVNSGPTEGRFGPYVQENVIGICRNGRAEPSPY